MGSLFPEEMHTLMFLVSFSFTDDTLSYVSVAGERIGLVG